MLSLEGIVSKRLTAPYNGGLLFLDIYLATVVWPTPNGKLEQFAVNPRSTPERVGKADCADQLPDVRSQLRTATERFPLPSPVQAKTCPVPPDYSF